MEITRDQIVELAQIQAQIVVNKLHRYAVTYQEPGNVGEGLLESMGEELTAADWYRRRAQHARECGDFETSALYESIATDEEDDHYVRLGKRLEEIQEAIIRCY